jgi:hypothetical protein
MKRLIAIGLLVILTTSVAMSATADSSYRILMFGCADGAPGFNLVPANTPLFVQSGWASGTVGLVRSAINNSTSTVADLRDGVLTVHSPVWGPIQQNTSDLGGFVSRWRVDLPPLAPGATATVTMTQSLAHHQTDLGLPTSDHDQPGLRYFAPVPAGIISLGSEPNPTVCTVTAT